MTPEDKSVSLTAQQRAEKIVLPLYLEVEPSIARDVAQRIAAQIREAVEEAVREAHPNYAIGYLMGMAKAEAFEEAAKIFDSMSNLQQGLLPKSIAALIRARAKEAAGK